MKTKKSKRFYENKKIKTLFKPRTLCLALLGTTLLMGRPVKAEEVSPNIGVEGTSQYYGEMQGEYDEEAELSSKDREFGRQNGQKDGKEGKNGFGPTINRDDIQVPEKVKHQDEYQDGYEQGYREGWQQEHPLLGVVFDVFDLIWGAVGGFFSLAN
ncbi:TPA: hypothetical protein ACQMHT_001508 [Streptococcus pyogenes]